ncbi:hypothetical protein PCO82_00660 [Pectobacteriaceae bacterium CE90]|nr:hypothetical protein PCO82_00660 [Pectobacteriaceae bacterium CE90]
MHLEKYSTDYGQYRQQQKSLEHSASGLAFDDKVHIAAIDNAGDRKRVLQQLG